MEDEIEIQDMSFNSIESTQSNLLSEISIRSYEERSESESSEELEQEIFDELENPENETCKEFPNEAYKDLMLLVTKNKLNNKAGNEIIRFFNKHSNLSKSPLPKNIEKGREFINNMKICSLEFDKLFLTTNNDKDYFLYCQNL